MLTMLATPKAFTGLFDVIQTNAITSWTTLDPRPEIILFGNDPGAAELCAALGLRHHPDVETNEFGTPLLSDILTTGERLASHDALCFVNADIIFTSGLMEAAKLAADRAERTLIVGRRLDIDLTTPLDVTDPEWRTRLERRARHEGELKPVVWIDYFLYRKGLWHDLPPFAVGRPGYDNWLLWRAVTDGATLVDATAFICAVHQRHDYSHAGGKKKVWDGAEAARNDDMIADWRRKYSIAYAREVLDDQGRFAPARDLEYRLARPRTYASHLLRFTRPLRRRLQGERATWRRSPPPPPG